MRSRHQTPAGHGLQVVAMLILCAVAPAAGRLAAQELRPLELRLTVDQVV